MSNGEQLSLPAGAATSPPVESQCDPRYQVTADSREKEIDMKDDDSGLIVYRRRTMFSTNVDLCRGTLQGNRRQQNARNCQKIELLTP